MQLDGKLDNGVSTCEVGYSLDGKITITEHFEWKSRPGEFGTNVFEELPPKEMDHTIGINAY